MIHVTNPWIAPRFTMIEDEIYKKAAERIDNKLCALVAKTQEDILIASSEVGWNQATQGMWDQDFAKILFSGIELFAIRVRDTHRLMLPAFYRKVYAKLLNFPANIDQFKIVFNRLFRNNLVLTDVIAVPGKGGNADFFLCVELDVSDFRGTCCRDHDIRTAGEQL